jgi:hypothetical protein
MFPHGPPDSGVILKPILVIYRFRSILTVVCLAMNSLGWASPDERSIDNYTRKPIRFVLPSKEYAVRCQFA